MARRKPQRGPRKQARPPTSSSGVSVRREAGGEGWVLVHPRCVRDRAEDLEEVHAMIEADELDVAIDELRWLLSGCSEFIEAHRLLGELALAVNNDVSLARGHFGFAYQLALQTLRRANMPVPLRYAHPANRGFFEAGRGLVWCLHQMGHAAMVDEIVETLIDLDPGDPLELRQLVATLRAAGLPVVDLLASFPKAPPAEQKPE